MFRSALKEKPPSRSEGVGYIYTPGA
jgi:hypothetical protein